MADKGGLPKLVRQECETHLCSGHFDDAVLTALKWVEKRLTLSAGNPPVFGTAAVDRALGQGKGTIRFSSESERRGTAELLRGLMTLYRNPAAHGFPALSAEEAQAVVELADALLVRIGQGVAQAAGVALGLDASEVIIFDVADLDGDGNNEMLVGILTTAATARRVVVLKNAPQGYLARTLVEDAEHVFGVEARDVDRDGTAEVMIYEGAGGPGAWLDVVRWRPERTERVQRIKADLARFTWSQPDGDGSYKLVVQGRSFGGDGEWVKEHRSFRWRDGRLLETERYAEPWFDDAGARDESSE